MIRLISIVLLGFVTLHGSIQAQTDEGRAKLNQLRAEMESVWNQREFAVVRAKTTLWDRDITPAMTQDDEIATEQERLAMSKWADQFARFGPQTIKITQAMFSQFVAPALADIMERYYKREMALTKSLSLGELTWGSYNSQRIASAGQQFQEYVQLSQAWEAAREKTTMPIPGPKQ